MSMTNNNFKNVVEAILEQKDIIKSAQEQIAAIKDSAKEEFGFDKPELTHYANKLYKKMEDISKYVEESELFTRIYEEIDNYDS